MQGVQQFFGGRFTPQFQPGFNPQQVTGIRPQQISGPTSYFAQQDNGIGDMFTQMMPMIMMLMVFGMIGGMMKGIA